MATEVNTPAPEALVSSPQLAAEVLEIEAKPNSAEATTATPTTGKPESNVDELDSHQLAMLQVALSREKTVFLTSWVFSMGLNAMVSSSAAKLLGALSIFSNKKTMSCH